MIKHLKNQKGFTLLQIIMGLVVGGLIAGLTSEILMGQAESYSYITNKKEALSDVRFALNRFTNELMRMQDSGDITGATASQIQFYDKDGSSVSYSLQTDSSSGTLMLARNGESIVDNIDSISFQYYDSNGTELTNPSSSISSIRRIKITIATDEVNNQPGVTLTTSVTPRVFIGYNGFQ